MQTTDAYRQARLSRDPRFDGVFFIAVKTTGVYCRPICPATPPKEKNVSYYTSAMDAAIAGYRPCLRCRPDSAPRSPAWKGASTTFERSLTLINEGALLEGSVSQLAERLGISERYLNKLFSKHIGVSPKRYALYQQCLFAKQLLHQTPLPINQVAFASGFNSIRRFNDCFKSYMQLCPSAIRNKKKTTHKTTTLKLKLYFRPPYNWQYVNHFLSSRVVQGIDWSDNKRYGRTFNWHNTKGKFTAHFIAEKNYFHLEITLDNLQNLYRIVKNIRRILDLDADINTINHCIKTGLGEENYTDGLRLPGLGCVFEAGIRAILGQQISVSAAHQLLNTLVKELGKPYYLENEQSANKLFFFPEPEAIANHPLDFFKMPAARKQTLRDFSTYHLNNIEAAAKPDNWQIIKGIGPWTIQYAKLRGSSDPDIFLAGDVGVKKALAQLTKPIDPDTFSPWRSYLSLQLWNNLI